jgi:hypothetical protein
MPWKCEGICHDYYYDDEPRRTLPTGEVVCPFCAGRPLREQFDLTREIMHDSIMLFRYEYEPPAGYYYEAFEDDADKLAAVLKLTTSVIGNTWMVGFSVEFLESYLAKLIGAGHRVALCDRESDAEHERFVLRNANIKQQEPANFMPLPKGRQKPLLRGLGDCPGQMSLFDGADIA